MKRKKIRATKKNKEKIKKYKESTDMLKFCGDTNVKVVCTKCKRTSKIRTHNPELFTEEVRKNFVCLLCKGR